MQRPWAIAAGISCCLLALSFVANVVAIRHASRLPDVPPTRIDRSVELQIPGSDAAAEASRSEAPADAPADARRASIRERADALAQEMRREGLGPLAGLDERAPTTHSEFVLAAPRRGLWVTRTEIRLPCDVVERELAELRDPGLGRPRLCERWVEATAAVLERHGIDTIGPREFLETYGTERDVRVVLMYAGWTLPADAADAAPDLAHVQLASVYPRDQFGAARRSALDAVYAALELGPYRAEH